MSRGYKKFIDKYLEESKYWNNHFVVSYTTLVKGEGAWMPFNRNFYETFYLDKEDLEYLYNKYKDKAVEEAIEDEKQEAKTLKRSIEDLQKAIQNKQERLNSLNNN